jgi:hypothetical protein
VLIPLLSKGLLRRGGRGEVPTNKLNVKKFHSQPQSEIIRIFVKSKGVPCLRNQTQKQAENIPIDSFVLFYSLKSPKTKNAILEST